MRKNAIKLLACLLLMPIPAMAGSWTGPVRIDQLRIFDGDLVLGVAHGANFLCGSITFIVDDNIAKADLLLDWLLQAQLNSATVELYQSGECDPRNESRTLVTGLRFCRASSACSP